MARTCGLRLGPRRYELVVLDGNVKKHRIAGFASGELPRGGEDPRGEAAELLRDAVKEHSIPLDSVRLVIDTGLAAFRTVRLPFQDPDKIEQVLKFEVENQLPQWNIDEVVVDFLNQGKQGEETSLLVTAVPKRDAAAALELCQKAGIEPHEVELEATAMVDACAGRDIFHEDDAQVLVHIGELTTSVVVMDGGIVRSIRAIRIGALSHERPVAAPGGEAPENGEPAAPAAPELGPEELAERVEQAVARLRRELVRTVSAAQTLHPIEAIYVCGMELPGLVGSQILDVPVYVLDVFEEESGQAAEGAAPLVVAYGAALHELGGGLLDARLRREELRFTGKFERVEMPLAMASVLLVTWLAVFNIFEYRQLQLRTRDVRNWLYNATLFMLGEPREGIPGNLDGPSPELKRYVSEVRDGQDEERGVLEQFDQLEYRLNAEIFKLEKMLGRSEEFPPPQSALEALTRVTVFMADMGDDLGRVSLHKVDAAYQAGKAGRDDTVTLRLDITFFGESSNQATIRFERLQRDLRAEPWCVSVEARTTKPLENGKGISIDGLEIVLDLTKAVDEEGDRA